MKRLTAFMSLVCFGCLVNAQQVYFNNAYDFYGVWEGATNVVETDSGYVSVGFVGSVVGDREIGALFMDSVGNEVQKKSFGQVGYEYNQGYGGSLTPTSDGGYALAGSIIDPLNNWDALLVKYDSNLDTLWTRTYGDTAFLDYTGQCKQTRDGGYILVGGSDRNTPVMNILLIKTDSLGNLEWDTAFGGSLWDIGSTIDTCMDGGYIIGGLTENFGAGMEDGLVIKTDSVGNQQWQKTFGGVYDDFEARVIATSDGGYAVCSNETQYFFQYNFSKGLIAKLDSNGNEEWSRKYGQTERAADFWMIRELSDGGFVVSGVTDPPYTSALGVVGTATPLNLL